MAKKKQLLKLLIAIPSLMWAIILMVSGGRLENEIVPVIENYLLRIGVSVTAINLIAGAIFIAPILWYIWGVRKDKNRKPLKPDEEETVRAVRAKNRSKYLSPLKSKIKKRLEICNQLALKAGKYPLDGYRERYLPFQKNKRPMAIQQALFKRNFMWDNQYYQFLKETNTKLQTTIREYDFYYVQIQDNKLKTYLKQLWNTEHWVYSSKSYAILTKSEKRIPNTITGLKIGKVGEKIETKALDIALGKVLTRIKELLDGDEDE